MEVEIDPLREFGAEVLLRDAEGADPARLARGLEFREGEGRDAFRFDNLGRYKKGLVGDKTVKEVEGETLSSSWIFFIRERIV